MSSGFKSIDSFFDRRPNRGEEATKGGNGVDLRDLRCFSRSAAQSADESILFTSVFLFSARTTIESTSQGMNVLSTGILRLLLTNSSLRFIKSVISSTSSKRARAFGFEVADINTFTNVSAR